MTAGIDSFLNYSMGDIHKYRSLISFDSHAIVLENIGPGLCRESTSSTHERTFILLSHTFSDPSNHLVYYQNS